MSDEIMDLRSLASDRPVHFMGMGGAGMCASCQKKECALKWRNSNASDEDDEHRWSDLSLSHRKVERHDLLGQFEQKERDHERRGNRVDRISQGVRDRGNNVDWLAEVRAGRLVGINHSTSLSWVAWPIVLKSSIRE